MLKILLRSTMLMVALTILASSVAQAANIEYCQQYAQEAVNHVRAGREKPGCATDMQGPRWSVSLRVHFNYCMSNPVNTVENARSARDEYLRSCGAIR